MCQWWPSIMMMKWWGWWGCNSESVSVFWGNVAGLLESGHLQDCQPFRCMTKSTNWLKIGRAVKTLPVEKLCWIYSAGLRERIWTGTWWADIETHRSHRTALLKRLPSWITSKTVISTKWQFRIKYVLSRFIQCETIFANKSGTATTCPGGKAESLHWQSSRG